MGKKSNYSASFKFKVVLEAITSGKTEAEVARSYNVHPVTLSNWKSRFMEEGAKVFRGNGAAETGDLTVPFKVPVQLRPGERGRLRLVVQTATGGRHALDHQRIPGHQDLVVATRPHALLAGLEQFVPA